MEPKEYLISIERNGKMILVGHICGESYQTAQFSYFDSYLDNGNAVLIDEISEKSFKEAASDIQMGEKCAIGRYHLLCDRFRGALRDAASELMEAGFSKAKVMEERILRTGGYSKI